MLDCFQYSQWTISTNNANAQTIKLSLYSKQNRAVGRNNASIDAVCEYHDGLGNHAQFMLNYSDTYDSSSKLRQCLNPSSSPRVMMLI